MIVSFFGIINQVNYFTLTVSFLFSRMFQMMIDRFQPPSAACFSFLLKATQLKGCSNPVNSPASLPSDRLHNTAVLSSETEINRPSDVTTQPVTASVCFFNKNSLEMKKILEHVISRKQTISNQARLSFETSTYYIGSLYTFLFNKISSM